MEKEFLLVPFITEALTTESMNNEMEYDAIP